MRERETDRERTHSEREKLTERAQTVRERERERLTERD